ncbi:MAG: hypothetical protein ACREKL_00375 [Chthoniobacterales bacterium]
MTEATHRLRLLFDWASAQDTPRRLALWLFAALLIHAGAFLLFRVTWPPAAPVRISDANIYVLLPGSPDEKRLAPFLAAADPALFAPERPHGHEIPAPAIPAYRPSFAVAVPQPVPLPDAQSRMLPPLIRDTGPVPVADESAPATLSPSPAERTQVIFSSTLGDRAPKDWPQMKFTARPGDELAPARFLIAVAPDGRVLHIVKDSPHDVLDDDASQYLMRLRFNRGADSQVMWGTATFYWGLDVKREEPR